MHATGGSDETRHVVLLPANEAQALAFVVLVEANALERLNALTRPDDLKHAVVEIPGESPLGFCEPRHVCGPLDTYHGKVSLYVCFEQLKLLDAVRLTFRIRNELATELAHVAAPVVGAELEHERWGHASLLATLLRRDATSR
ncbi:MAG TPA: hypothetical protein VED41_04040 [Solirubrobacteraceae bacterium]|nr:hypothetical protein [Solirubrobacteraceae bacterium]